MFEKNIVWMKIVNFVVLSRMNSFTNWLSKKTWGGREKEGWASRKEEEELCG